MKKIFAVCMLASLSGCSNVKYVHEDCNIKLTEYKNETREYAHTDLPNLIFVDEARNGNNLDYVIKDRIKYSICENLSNDEAKILMNELREKYAKNEYDSRMLYVINFDLIIERVKLCSELNELKGR